MNTRIAPFFARAADSDLWHSFKRTPGAVIAAIVTLAIVLGAVVLWGLLGTATMR